MFQNTKILYLALFTHITLLFHRKSHFLRSKINHLIIKSSTLLSSILPSLKHLLSLIYFTPSFLLIRFSFRLGLRYFYYVFIVKIQYTDWYIKKQIKGSYPFICLTLLIVPTTALCIFFSDYHLLY